MRNLKYHKFQKKFATHLFQAFFGYTPGASCRHRPRETGMRSRLAKKPHNWYHYYKTSVKTVALLPHFFQNYDAN